MPTAEAYTFRPVVTEDLRLLESWLGEPHVRRWWGEPAKQVAEISSHMTDTTMDVMVVEYGGTPFAYLQAWRVPASDMSFGDWPDETIGIDQFIGLPEMVGIGHGPAMIDAFVEAKFAAGIERVVLDPHPENAHAIRAYEKAGFHVFDQRITEDGPALIMVRDHC